MVEFVEVARLAEVPPGTAKCVEVHGARVAVVNVDGVVHAFPDACPHAQGPLSEGELDGPVLTCPWHGWTFDVPSGASLSDPPARLESFEVRIEDERVLVGGRAATING